MKNNYPYYPEIDTKKSEGISTSKTTLRKLHNGKWYLWDIIEVVEGTTLIAMYSSIKRVHVTAYLISLFGKVDEFLVDVKGESVFKLDDNQQSEQERFSFNKDKEVDNG